MDHGSGGHDFMDGTPEALIGAAEAHARHGTTCFVPTTLSATDEEILMQFQPSERRRPGGTWARTCRGWTWKDRTFPLPNAGRKSLVREFGNLS